MTAAPEVTADFLEHFGVKGMKWGVRRAEKKMRKADAKWQKNIYTMQSHIAVHNNAADKMNNGLLDSLNNKPKYKKLPDWDPDSLDPDSPQAPPLLRQYIKEYYKLSETVMNQAVREVHGSSPSGGYRARYDPNNGGVVVEKVDVEHAADEIPTRLFFEVNVVDGHIVSIKKVKEEAILSQSSVEEASDFLEHYGVKGMRWGVRRGKETVKISNDAKRADYALKKVNPKIQTQYKPLSNNALKDLKTRLQLEADLKKLMPTPEPAIQKKINAGQKHLAWAIGVGFTVNRAIAFSKSPAGQAIMNRIIQRPDGRHFSEGRHFG